MGGSGCFNCTRYLWNNLLFTWTYVLRISIFWLTCRRNIGIFYNLKLFCFFAFAVSLIAFSRFMVGDVASLSLLPVVGAWLGVIFLFYSGMTIYMIWSDKHMQIDSSRSAHFPMTIISDEEAPVSYTTSHSYCIFINRSIRDTDNYSSMLLLNRDQEFEKEYWLLTWY